MSKPLKELLSLLQLEKLEEGLFRGQSENLGLPQVYGGQVIGQALSAARYTVEEARTVHSFHSYFLYPEIQKSRSSMTSRTFVMVVALVLVELKPFKMVARFST